MLAAAAGVFAAVSVAALPAASAGIRYAPRLIVTTGQHPTETDFAIHVQHGAPATAEVDLYVPAGYTASVGQAPGTQIGTLTGDAEDRGLTAPFSSGTIVVADPTAYASSACDSASHSAVWLATLTSATTTFSFPIFVRTLAGQPTELHWCLAKTAPQLATTALHLVGVFTQPVSGNHRWDARLQPYDPDSGLELASEQVSSLVTVRLPQTVALKTTRSPKTHQYRLTVRAREAGSAARGYVRIWRSVGGRPYATSPRISPLRQLLPSGSATVTERLSTSKTVRFRAQFTASPTINQNCGKDLNGVPCVNASTQDWEQGSNVVAIHP